MADFTLLIKDWYRQNKRDLPWRTTNDPYIIWLSEIILQQTRVDQGLSYFNNFVKNFPTVKDLAKADEQEVLKLWQGLGYYSRARNLHFTAKFIANDLNGTFPDNYADLQKLKGVGKYTAAAIASFSYKEPVAVVDGNVYRVLSRVFDIESPIDSNKGQKVFSDLAQSLIDIKEPDIYNQAIMEFGALYCSPANPDCENCTLNSLCLSFANKSIENRPFKEKKTKVRNRYFNFLVFNDGSDTFIQQRKSKDIWQQLFQFPLVETENSELLDWKQFSEKSPEFVSEEIIHLLSHQRLHAKFYHFNNSPKEINEEWLSIKQDDIQNYPLPRLIDRYLQSKV